jgi:hypothetical protein
MNLGYEVYLVFGPAIDLLVASLPAEAFDLTDGHTCDPDIVQGLFDVIQFKGLYDCLDLLHLFFSC